MYRKFIRIQEAERRCGKNTRVNTLLAAQAMKSIDHEEGSELALKVLEMTPDTAWGKRKREGHPKMFVGEFDGNPEEGGVPQKIVWACAEPTKTQFLAGTNLIMDVTVVPLEKNKPAKHHPWRNMRIVKQVDL